MNLQELVDLGRIVQDAQIVTEADQNTASTRFERYMALVAQIEGSETAEVLDALLRSVHSVNDYGAYEATYNAIWGFPPSLVGEVVARILPSWLSEFDAAAENVERMLLPLPSSSPAFVEAMNWSPSERVRVLTSMEIWVSNSPEWETIFVSLGGVLEKNDDPAGWDPTWDGALEAFRRGSIAEVWTDKRSPVNNFPVVFALLEMEHGTAWRSAGELLNPFVSMARRVKPEFLEALAALPLARRERIESVIRRTRPGFLD